MSKNNDLPEDSDSHEIFDITDFTTASDWERFVVNIENLINEWKLNSSSDNKNDIDIKDNDINFETGEWQEKTETIQYAEDISFTITYYALVRKQNLSIDSSTDASVSKSGVCHVADQQTANSCTYDELTQGDFDSLPISSIIQPKKKCQSENLEDDLSFCTNLVNLPPKSMADLLNKSNDFLVNYSNLITTPLLAYWYGVCKFVLVTPTRSNNFIDDETRSCVILSSVTTAVNNTSCLIPIFIQVLAPQRDMYVGICEGSALKTHFNVLQFNYVPVQYAYLPGLLEVFKSKLGNHLTNSSLLISVSIRFTYLILENTFLDYQQATNQYQNNNILENKTVKSNSEIELIENKKEDIYPDIKNLPYGSVQDCIDSIYLSCIWSNLSEDIVVDSETFSDLNPQQSIDWSLTINNIMDKCGLQLNNLLIKYFDEIKRTISVNQILGGGTSLYNSSSSNRLIDEELRKSSLQKLASAPYKSSKLDQVYNLSSNMVEKATNKMKILNLNDTSLPLDKEFIEFIMDYLFPDANLTKSSKSKFSINQQSQQTDLNSIKVFLKKLNLMKSSSIDNSGLLNKLVICLALVNQIGKTKAIAQLWREFLLELRFRYESNVLIPNVSSSLYEPDSDFKSSSKYNADSPDLSRCMLHQKLQMLNCCIKKKIERNEYETNTHTEKSQKTSNQQEIFFNEKVVSNNNDDEDDQFFDCEDENEPIEDQKLEDGKILCSPEGRLRKIDKLTLLNQPNEPIYVPITQEPTPMTEDMIEQHASILENIGSSDDAAFLRAKVQSASLLSDMQSFKAANPNCVIEDFVRWYSPRDWVEYEEKEIDPNTNEEKIFKKYGLSTRMKVDGNIWMDVWKSAKPVPVRRQKRLFDDTKEAENVFDWLHSLNIGQIIEHTLPILFYSAIFASYKESSKLDIIEFVESIFDVLTDKAIKFSRINDAKKFQELINYIKSIEQLNSLMKSLNTKFMSDKSSFNKNNENEVKDFLKLLLKAASSHVMYEVKITNGANSTIGKLITKLCYGKKQIHIKSNINKIFPNQYHSVNKKEHEENYLEEDEHDNTDENSHIKLTPFDKPFKREYILRSSCSRPAPYSRQSPQRMYCLITDSEFRLAGAFTEDTMFF